MANDVTPAQGAGVAAPSIVSGFALAVTSALSFALSGPLARGLLDTGWNAASVVLIRIAIAAIVLAPFGFRAVAGRGEVLRANWRLITLYGLLAVAGAQFCYFSAVGHLPVALALLLEYTAPAAVVMWMWLRHAQRPGPLTLVGAVIAAAGLVLVLDVLGGEADLSTVGILWGLGAMVGAAAYFVISAQPDTGLPPITLAAGGLLVGGAGLAVLVVIGILDWQSGTAPARYGTHEVAWWLPLLALGLVTAAFAYVLGVMATRILGSRLASFVALLEVVAAVVFAWLLLGELPTAVQLLGGLLILAGIVAVKLGEPDLQVGPELELDVP